MRRSNGCYGRKAGPSVPPLSWTTGAKEQGGAHSPGHDARIGAASHRARELQLLQLLPVIVKVQDRVAAGGGESASDP